MSRTEGPRRRSCRVDRVVGDLERADAVVADLGLADRVVGHLVDADRVPRQVGRGQRAVGDRPGQHAAGASARVETALSASFGSATTGPAWRSAGAAWSPPGRACGAIVLDLLAGDRPLSDVVAVDQLRGLRRPAEGDEQRRERDRHRRGGPARYAGWRAHKGQHRHGTARLGATRRTFERQRPRLARFRTCCPVGGSSPGRRPGRARARARRTRRGRRQPVRPDAGAAHGGRARHSRRVRGELAFSGLSTPVAVRFAAEGSVFVAEKHGIVKRFSGLGDATPETIADVRAAVHDYWDRGLIGLAVDPAYPGPPYIYLSYAWDHLGRWPTTARPRPGATDDGCVVDARIARVNVNSRQETVLVSGGWCQQFPSHASAGSRSAPTARCTPAPATARASTSPTERPARDPCGDPPADRATTRRAEGGALRAQDLRTAGDPVGLDGTILRIDPDTGAAAPATRSRRSADANAAGSSPTACATRSAIAFRPARTRSGSATSAGTTGRRSTGSPRPATRRGATSAGPATRAPPAAPGTQLRQPDVCEGLYAQAGAHTAPYFAYRHAARVVPDDAARPAARRSPGSRSTTAAPTRPSTTARCSSPTTRATASGRCCPGANGLPTRRTSRRSSPAPPTRSTCRSARAATSSTSTSTAARSSRIRALAGNQPPTRGPPPRPTSGPAPLTVAFDGARLDRPGRRPLTYAWDLDGDGAYDDGSAAAPTWSTRAAPSRRVRVRDRSGARTPRSGDHAGQPALRRHHAPAAGRRGRSATRSPSPAAATDPQDGALPRERADLAADPPPLPVATATPPDPQTSPGRSRARSPRPTTSTRRTWSCG